MIEVRQVNTYSWHPGTRGPQVYKLYAADGSAPEFDPQPKKDTGPGEMRLETRRGRRYPPKSGEAGGQYGVSVSDSARGIGKFRYLLFDISATEKDDPFGNTFLQRNRRNRRGRAETARSRGGPAARLISKSPASAPYQITIDYTDAPELKDWVEKKLQPTADKWYPKIIEALPSKNYTAPARVSIAITDDYHGVAATGGNRVVCSAAWFKRNYNGEGPGRWSMSWCMWCSDTAAPGAERPIRAGWWRDRGLYPLVQVRAKADRDAAAEPGQGQVHRQLSHDGGVPEFRGREARQGDRGEAQRGHAPGQVQRRPVEGVHRQDGG